MALHLNTAGGNIIKRAGLIAAVVALVIQPCVGIVNSATSARALATPTSQISGFGSLNWYADRTLPSGGYNISGDTLSLSIDNTKARSEQFYKTEGVKADLPAGNSINTVKSTLTIDPTWASKPVRAGLWLTTTSSSASDMAWPIIEYANNIGGYTGVRVFDTMTTGTWTNIPGYTGQSSLTFEISVNPDNGKYEFAVNGTVVSSYSAEGYTTIKDIIFDSYNSGLTAAENYNVQWSKLVLTAVQAKPTVSFVSPVEGSYNPSKYAVVAADNSQLVVVTANLYDATNSRLLKSCSARALTVKEYTLVCPVPADLTDGTYTVKYNAVDASGNLSTTKTAQFKVDHSKPTVTVKSDSVGSTSANVYRTANFKLHDNMLLAGYTVNNSSYSVSPNAWSDANGVKVGSRGGVYGKNTITAVDQAGNKSDSLVFYLDNVAPRMTVKPTMSVGTNGSYRSISLALYDEYQVDKVVVNGVVKDLSNNKWSDLNYLKPGQFGGIEGVNTIELYDVAGNVTTQTFTIDTTAPTASFTYSNNNGNAVTKDPVTVTMTTNEPIATPPVDWTKDSDTVYTRVYTENAKDSVTIVDFAGNQTTAKYEVKRIDTVAPVIMLNGFAPEAKYTGEVSIVVTEDNFRSLTINGEQVSPTSTKKPYVFASLKNAGPYELVAADKAGNESKVIFDIVAPVVELPGRDDRDNGDANKQDSKSPNTGSRTGGSPQVSNGELPARNVVAAPAVYDGYTVAVADTASDQEGNVLGAQTPADTASTGAQDDEGQVLGETTTQQGCAKFFGICWYWWIPVGVGIVAIVWWGAYRHRAHRANV